MLAKHIKIIVICNIHDGQFRQNSHLLAAIHFNGMSFQLQIIITIMINTWLNALCTGKKSIQLSTQWVIICVMMHVIVMYNIVFIARDAASKILTFLNANYNRNCLIRHRLICQFTEFVTFLSVLSEFLSFVYISVRLICSIRHLFLSLRSVLFD